MRRCHADCRDGLRLTPPPAIAATRANPAAGIMVDACIAPVIDALWRAGVVTLGCCCGHGERPPSIVLGDGERDQEHVRAVIASVDERDFTLLQWKLVTLPAAARPVTGEDPDGR